MVKIIKASGEKEEFDKNRIKKSVLKAGASQKLAQEVANKVSKEVREGMKTRDILDRAINLLKKMQPEVAARYDLKRAIMMLGPHGFSFEEYLSQILRHYGYKTTTGNIVQGKVVTHEVDVIAEKEGKYMIEAKYHNSLGVHTDTKVALYTYARFLDLKSNPKNNFTQPWLITNTRCTHRATKYSKGVGQKIIGWSYPKKGNLQELIEKKGLYPVTIFKSVSESIKNKLFNAKIIIVKDLANHSLNELKSKTGLDEKILRKILEESKKICNNC